ncbi:hypothetical protein [Streptomyces sp. NPDC060205]|uniref:hypothetical protein n=1 Tax=Streptomyces sp. NPDC060205 TaxID=3347072 RepID=UPI0036484DC8
MTGSTLMLSTLHRGERHLARQLRTVAERHGAEHEIHYIAMDLARWSEEHVQVLADTAQGHGLELTHSGGATPVNRAPVHPDGGTPTLNEHLVPALVLLRDLRELHLGAVENSLHWEMLAQAAQALKDDELLALVTTCHPRTLRQMRWTNTMIKNMAPQILSNV